MKLLKYALFALIIAFSASGCVEDAVGPLNDDDIIIPPPPPPPCCRP